MTWQHYLKQTVDELRPRYVELCEQVAMGIEDLGKLQADEKERKLHGFKSSAQSSVAGREWDATLEAGVLPSEIIRVRSELEATKEERDLVRWVLDARADA